jgi:cell division initiation protein
VAEGALPLFREELTIMRISPLDIRKQVFKKSMRGVDAEEVRIFLELVASEYEKVLQENAMLAERTRYQEERLTEYVNLEKSMRNSLVTADRIASESREVSERHAAQVVQEAQMRAERILEDARERLQDLIREIETLKGKKEVYAHRFWALVDSQVAMLQEHMQENGEIEALRRRVGQLVADSPATASDGSATSAGAPGRSPWPETRTPQVGPDDPDEELETRAPAREGYAVGPTGSEQARYAPSGYAPVSGYGPASGHGPVSGDARYAHPAGLEQRSDGRPEPETEEPAPAKTSAARGLLNLFRSRQASLPLGNDQEAPPKKGQLGRDNGDQEDQGGFYPIRERREAFYELRARDGKEPSDPARDPKPGNGR